MKYCPHCGAEVPAYAKFCTKCGYDLSAIQNAESSENESQENEQQNEEKNPQSEPSTKTAVNLQEKITAVKNNENVQQLSTSAQGYWKWLVSSWKHPFKVQQSRPWAGITSLIIEIVLYMLGLTVSINRILNNIEDVLSSSNLFNSSDIPNLSPTGMIFRIFIFTVISTAIMLGGTYLVRKFLYQKEVNFWQFTNQVAHYSNLNLILNLVVLFLCLISSSISLLFLFTAAIIGIFWLALYASVLTPQLKARYDKIYAGIIVWGINTISTLLYVYFIWLMFSQLLAKLITDMEQIFN